MRAGQRETGRAVIEGCRRPAGCVVAGRTVCRSERRSGSGVHRIIRLLPGGQVTLRIPAIGGGNRQVVIIVDVAGGAGHIRVARGQRKSGGVVIECRGGPADRCMARRAIRNGECRSRGRMNGIRRGLPGGQMAAGISAIVRRNRQVVIIVYMAKSARNVGVAIREQESCGAMVELRVLPGVKCMATGAVGSRKFRSCGLVFRVGGSQPIGHVAGGARRRKSDIISHRGILVAFIALHHRVRAEQGKPVEVVLNGLRRNLPTQRRVALRTVLTHLRAVNIRVATRAIFTYVRKDWFRVATRAGNF